MPKYNASSDETIRYALEALMGGNGAPLMAACPSPGVVHDIRRIVNIYTNHLPPSIAAVVAETLKTPSPGAAIRRLERLLAATGGDPEIVPPDPAGPRTLAAILAASSALSARIAADPSLTKDLPEPGDISAPHTDAEYYTVSIRRMMDAAGAVPANIVGAIHRGHTLHLLRLCVRNTDPAVSIRVISAELSALAEAVVSLSMARASREVFARFGLQERQHNLVVLGLGKLGGGELNVSSDIDILYLCADRDETWGSHDTVTFHTMIAERLTRILTEATPRGALYRVDTRLRADGASGPLVRKARDYIRYLELRGRGWERQMLLKARPVAGDVSVAERFFRSVKRFIFPTGITRSPNQEIVAIKNQIEAGMAAEGSKKTHIKLMTGGIRDIEFIAQCLQLLMGGGRPEVRCPGTLDALDRLREVHAVSDSEHRILTDAYMFFRSVENVLQWRELLPAFSLPDEPETLAEVEAFLGLESIGDRPGEALRQAVETRRLKVRAIYDEIFNAGAADGFKNMAVEAACAPYGDERAKRFLESLGFVTPSESLRHLASLAFGGERTTDDITVHPSAERFLPVLLKTLSELADPDGALERFVRVAESYKARHTLFGILADNTLFLRLLVDIVHGSVFIANILIRDPWLVDWLFETAEILHAANRKSLARELERIESDTPESTPFTRSALVVKNREYVRIGARDITGQSSTVSTFRDLTTIAELLVRAAYDRAFNEVSTSVPALRADYAFAVIAAGRLGAGAMNFGSDLDLIFVYRAGAGNSGCIELPEYSVRLAARLLALITDGGGSYKIYDVDARLRPEGGNSPLAISLDSYRSYLERRASEWERLALIRCRHVAGSASLGKETESAIQSFVYRKPFTPEEIHRIREIRAAMIEASLKRHPGLVNIKSGPGGIADIDFIAQAWAAHHGAERASLRVRETPAILSALITEGLIDRNDGASLGDLYGFLADVEKAIRIGSGKAVNTAPTEGPELSRVARLLGFSNIRKFLKRLDDVRSLTTEFHERFMSELLRRAEHGS